MTARPPGAQERVQAVPGGVHAFAFSDDASVKVAVGAADRPGRSLDPVGLLMPQPGFQRQDAG
jgi:hypothetical protein